MAKSTKAQQVSTGTPDSYTPDELADPTPPIRIQRAMLGALPEEVPPSVGTHSSPSSESGITNADNENQSPRQPVQTTENPSGQPEKETASTADLTVGDGQMRTEPPLSDEDEENEDEFEDEDEEETPEPVTKKASPAKKAVAKKATPKKANVRNTGDDFADFE